MTAKSNSELVERLRHPQCVDANCVKCRAADLLEHQAAEIARLRDNLTEREWICDREYKRNGVLQEKINALVDCLYKRNGCTCGAALGDTPAGLDRQGPRTDAR